MTRPTVALILSFCIAQMLHAQTIVVQDIFNRDISNDTVRLVDWEGYMANPAIELSITAPSGVSYPVTVELSGNHSRLYFDENSTVGSSGPGKTLSFGSPSTQDVQLSIFPDEFGGDELHTLTIEGFANGQGQPFSSQTIPIMVADDDSDNPVVDLDMILDFSHDTQYNFFDATNQAIVTKAANDWAYFLEDMGFDQVPANTAYTFIWNDSLPHNGGNWVLNPTAYDGFYLYAYGIHANTLTASHLSGGAPSNIGFQEIGGNETELRRSGGYNADPHGNYNSLGWNTAITDDTWYMATNLGNVQNDLYSIALHEIGHALGFNNFYPGFDTFLMQGFVDDPDVVSYHGSNVPADSFHHLYDGSFVLDRVSKKGAFGSGYAEEMPLGRLLITKLDLLVLQAIGYDLKETSAFHPVAIQNTTLANGQVGSQYTDRVEAKGGIPCYEILVSSGSLPPGLTLNSFTGVISGSPTTAGTYVFTVQVRDHDFETVQQSFTIEVIEPAELSIKLMLEGPYDVQSQIMKDDLRSSGHVPIIEPFSSLGYSFPNNGTPPNAGGPNSSIDAGVLNATGPNAIVDWVIVELRNAANPAEASGGILWSRAALLQRDGDIVELDGTSPIEAPSDFQTFYIAVQHRNHLPAMTSQPVVNSSGQYIADFSSPTQSLYGNMPSRKNVSGKMIQVTGDVNFNQELQYTGLNNDRDPILVSIGGSVPTNTINGYYSEDSNMDGTVKYTGIGNDRDPILVNIGGNVPTAIRTAQLP